jgi:D-alanyl-D-alanine carboxypeptidase
VQTIEEIHRSLGIPPSYGRDPPLPRFREATELVAVEPNIVGRVQELTPETAAAWAEMKARAQEDGVALLLVSGFRSIERQVALMRRKLAQGQTLNEILKVNAAPGFSQHHTGKVLDVATPGCRPLTEEFETTPAFGWLCRNAAGFGFRLAYPRDNVEGFCYEPWHWSRLP